MLIGYAFKGNSILGRGDVNGGRDVVCEAAVFVEIDNDQAASLSRLSATKFVSQVKWAYLTFPPNISSSEQRRTGA